jgi:tRNA(Ile)-lysidine synthase
LVRASGSYPERRGSNPCTATRLCRFCTVQALERKVYEFIREHSLFAPRDVVLVAFSGGPDSTALAEILIRLRSLLGIELLLLHINHRLRKEESDRDEAHCVRWAEERGLPIIVERRDVEAFCRLKRLSLEEAARIVRYEVFEARRMAHGASCVALGHTLDDQAETVFMNIVRGTGLSGLRGMRPKEGVYVRPLLGVRRREIREFLEREGISFVEDSSNLDLRFLRNRIRHRVFPLLEEINPRIVEALARLSLNAREALALQEERNLPCVPGHEGGGIPLDALLLVPPSERPWLVRQFLREVRGTLWDVTRGQVEDILRLVEKRKGEVVLPGKVRVFVQGGYLWASASPLPLVDMPSWSFPLHFPGVHTFPDLGVVLEGRFTPFSGEVRGLVWREALDYGQCAFPLVLRNFREGDCMQWRGRERKLKELFEEWGIIREWRRLLPLLCDREKVLWIPGLALDERVRVQENSKSILHVELRRCKG